MQLGWPSSRPPTRTGFHAFLEIPETIKACYEADLTGMDLCKVDWNVTVLALPSLPEKRKKI